MERQKKIILILIAIFIVFLLFVFISNQSTNPSGFYDTIDGLNGITVR